MDLNDLESEQPRSRWVALHGHLEGVELLVKMASPKEARRFHARLLQHSIVRETRDNPFDVVAGREKDFFRAMAEMYVLDWRGNIKPEGTKYSVDTMGKVLGAYRRAFERLMEVIGEEDAFFEPAPSA
jgi:hypothetical protein